MLTIDPARRLAQSMGLTELDNTPRPVDGVDESEGGRLDAMMLDMKRTFDEIVLAHSTPERAEQILENPFYQSLSSSFSGTQEYMAMEKLGQLKDDRQVGAGRRRHPADPLGAGLPRRAAEPGALPGRPADPAAGRAGEGGRPRLHEGAVGRLPDLRPDLHQDHRRAGAAGRQPVRRRAGDDVRRVPAAGRGDLPAARRAGHAFVVVAAPEPAALREASYFVDRLANDEMPLAGLVVNRVTGAAPELPAERALAAAEELDSASDSDPLAAAVLRVHAERVAMATRQQRLAERFTRAHPEVPQAEVSALAGDVHDLDGLRAVARRAGRGSPPLRAGRLARAAYQTAARPSASARAVSSSRARR